MNTMYRGSKILTAESARRALVRLAATATSAAVLAGCALQQPLDIRESRKLMEQGAIESRPVVRPVRAITSFSESLACMDRVFRDARIGTTLIASKQIPDASGRMSVGTKEMVVTALSQMSRVSNAFRYVDYEVDIVRQDTVQNMTALMLMANQIQLQRPALYVSGAITYVDQNVLSNGGQAGTSATRLETGISADNNATVVGLELHLGDFRTRTLVPGIDSANEVVFGSRGLGLDVAARLGRYGVQLNLSRTTSVGGGASVRTLVELGMIELLGKWARVPYWQCLMLDQTHPEFQRQLRDWFDEMESPARVALVQRALATRGYLQGPFDGIVTPGFRSGLARFQADEKLVVSGELGYESYERLMRDYVEIDSDGRLVRVGWSPAGGDLARRTWPDPSAATAVGMTAAPQSQVADVQIANTQLVPGVFTAGERIYLTASTSVTSHMYCFYQDSSRRVTRLYPNMFQRSSLVQGNFAVRMPDWLSTNPGFAVEANSAGRELIKCYFTPDDVIDRLPEAVRAQPITPLPDVNSIEEVDAAFAALPAPGLSTSAMAQWLIRPRSAGAPPRSPESPPAPPVEGIDPSTETAPRSSVVPAKVASTPAGRTAAPAARPAAPAARPASPAGRPAVVQVTRPAAVARATAPGTAAAAGAAPLLAPGKGADPASESASHSGVPPAGVTSTEAVPVATPSVPAASEPVTSPVAGTVPQSEAAVPAASLVQSTEATTEAMPQAAAAPAADASTEAVTADVPADAAPVAAAAAEIASAAPALTASLDAAVTAALPPAPMLADLPSER